MRTDLACLPCFVRQVERTLSYAGVNGERGRGIMRRAGRILADASLDQAPARISTLLHRLIRTETGTDPYRQLKHEYTRIAMDHLPELRDRARSGGMAPLEAGVRAAIAGNVIDFGVYDRVDLGRAIDDAFRLPLPQDELARLDDALRQARTVLYLCDNAGEIVFDRVLIDELRAMGKDVTAAVKGIPVINDATREEADLAGLGASATRVIDNGNDGIGTLLELGSGDFREAYGSADVIVSKGQANFETLASRPDPRVFYLFMVKCPVVARELGRPEGDIVLQCGRRAALQDGH